MDGQKKVPESSAQKAWKAGLSKRSRNRKTRWASRGWTEHFRAARSSSATSASRKGPIAEFHVPRRSRKFDRIIPEYAGLAGRNSSRPRWYTSISWKPGDVRAHVKLATRRSASGTVMRRLNSDRQSCSGAPKPWKDPRSNPVRHYVGSQFRRSATRNPDNNTSSSIHFCSAARKRSVAKIK